jgi:hypothetical protein
MEERTTKTQKMKIYKKQKHPNNNHNNNIRKKKKKKKQNTKFPSPLT